MIAFTHSESHPRVNSKSFQGNAIYSIAVGETFSRMTLPPMREYSDRCRAPLIIADGTWMKKRHPSPHWLKLDIFRHFLASSHARMLYLDMDVFINPQTPDIFEAYPHGSYMTLNDDHKLRDFKGEYPGITHYYNTGVILAERADVKELLQHEVQPYRNEHCYEQTPLNRMVQSAGVQINALPAKWNASYHDLLAQSRPLSEEYFIHFSNRF